MITSLEKYLNLFYLNTSVLWFDPFTVLIPPWDYACCLTSLRFCGLFITTRLQLEYVKNINFIIMFNCFDYFFIFLKLTQTESTLGNDGYLTIRSGYKIVQDKNEHFRNLETGKRRNRDFAYQKWNILYHFTNFDNITP